MHLTPEDVSRLRDTFRGAGFTHPGVVALLGPVAHAALARNETTPGLRATDGGSPLETLTRLWPLQAPVTEQAAASALPGLVDPLCAAGLLARSAGEVRARVDVSPYAADGPAGHEDHWVVSDLTPGLDGSAPQVGPDHVLGVSPASTTLAELVPRAPAGKALDLGTGCGVQSLHLAGHVRDVVATDVNRRALAMARLTTALSGVAVDLRAGSLYEPVAGDTFDLVASNPPFVVSSGAGPRLVYRDSGLPGDEVVRRLVAGGADHLTPGGTAVLLANWVHRHDGDWAERVAAWLPPGTDAWVVQREVADVAAYVELWLRDAGHDRLPGYRDRYDAWARWLDEQGVTAVGLGWLVLRRSDREPSVRLEHWPWEVDRPLAPEVAAWVRRTDLLAALNDDQLLAAPWRVRDDVRQETHGAPGAEDPEAVVLRQERGMRRARRVGTREAALVGACDGDLPPAALAPAVVTLTGGEPWPTEDLARLVRELVADGFLTG